MSIVVTNKDTFAMSSGLNSEPNHDRATYAVPYTMSTKTVNLTMALTRSATAWNCHPMRVMSPIHKSLMRQSKTRSVVITQNLICQNPPRSIPLGKGINQCSQYPKSL